ncbi:MAG: helix-turn-helix domain-containing protein, partial [Chloroflexi bacterium]|nr:helix-turn-helix domain-containing protein [Chloroflexota bacterium]
QSTRSHPQRQHGVVGQQENGAAIDRKRGLIVAWIDDDVYDALESIMRTHDADITIRGISQATNATDGTPFSLTSLSSRQREVFELARARGYYEWPKEVSGTELATELDIATATLHEHLHKAEAKLLGNEQL